MWLDKYKQPYKTIINYIMGMVDDKTLVVAELYWLEIFGF